MYVAEFHELRPLLEKALAKETKDDTAHEMAVTAHGGTMVKRIGISSTALPVSGHVARRFLVRTANRSAAHIS